jgi:hypothetical protein
MEIWKDIIGYEGIYQISTLGNVKSLGNQFTKKEKMLKQKLDRNGYNSISLCKNGDAKHFLIHRLVAISFLYKKENKDYVNHLDGVKTNNNINNLEWVTASENQKHAFANGLNKISENAFKAMKAVVCKRVLNNSNGVIYESITLASKENNIKYSSLYRMLNGKSNNNTSLVYI